MNNAEIETLILNQYYFNTIFLSLKAKIAQAHYDSQDYNAFQKAREDLRVEYKKQETLKKAIGGQQ
jgi:hypothetical protein